MNNPLLLIPVFVLATPLVVGAAFSPPEGMSVDANGMLHVGDAQVGFAAATPNWGYHDNPKWEDVRREDQGDTRVFRGRFEFSGVPCEVEQRLIRTGPETVRAEAHWVFERPVFANGLFGTLNLRFPMAGEVRVDGTTIPVPEAGGTPNLRALAPARSFAATLRGGWELEVSGDLQILLQDNRLWGRDTIVARLHATPGSGDLREARVTFDVRVRSPGARPVPLVTEAAGTNRLAAAWPGATLYEESPERLAPAGFPFALAPSFLALGRGGLPANVAVDVPEGIGADAAAIELLHAAEWGVQAGNLFPRGTPVGRVRIGWADGGESSIDIGAETDVGHYADAGAAFANASVVWSAQRGDNAAALFASAFSIPGAAAGRRVARLAFESANPAAAWCVAAATLSRRPVVFPAEPRRATTCEEGLVWARLDWRRDTLPGGALDFSFVADALAPAGRDGFVTASPDGFLSFEHAPDKRLVLHGVNLCFSANYLEHDVADRLVETLRRAGYNSVRFHHHDSRLVRKDAETSLELDAENLDRLDYLIAALKKAGFYVTTDLLVNRPFRPGDGIDCENEATLGNPKSLLPISEKARANLKAFSRAWLLDHVNPYTGLPLAHDPVLATLSLVNEEFLVIAWGRAPELIPRYRARFLEWKAAKGLPEGDEASFPAFLSEIEGDLFRDLRAFVKDELGVRCPVVTTAADSRGLDPDRGTIGDVVDAHGYYAHPSFPVTPWQLPARFSLGSPIREEAVLPRNRFPLRLTDRPFTVSEIAYCYPTPHRMQGAPLLAAYSALQGWSGIWRFTWSHSDGLCDRIERPMTFEAGVDPYQQLGDRLIAALFARGDLAPSTNRLSWPVPASGGRYPEALAAAGLRAAVGCHVAGTPLPAGVREWTPSDGLPPPDPGVRLDPKAGTFAAVTPRTEALALERGDLAGDVLRVEGASRECVVAAISREDAPLGASGDVLVLHLTNLAATGLRWDANDLVGSWGRLPLLVARGTAHLSLAADGPRRIEALNADGEPVGEVESTYEDGRVRFLADTARFPGGVVGYRVQRKE